MSETYPEKPTKKRVKGYEVEATDDMTGHGWRKELIWRQVNEKNEQWFITQFHFTIDRFPCYNCKSADYSWLVPQRTGVYKVCLGCQTTTGPITMEDATQVGAPEPITPEDAERILRGRGIKRLPFLLVKQLRQRRSRVRRGRVRKDIEKF